MANNYMYLTSKLFETPEDFNNWLNNEELEKQEEPTIMTEPTKTYDKVCSVSGCELKHYARSYCNYHFYRNKAGKDITVLQPVNSTHGGTSRNGTCSQCDHPIQAKGLCKLHYDRIRRIGSFELPVKKEVCDCGEKVKAMGYCDKHYWLNVTKPKMNNNIQEEDPFWWFL
jgi:hypothetical protein